MDFDGVRYWDVREIDRWYHKLKDYEFDPLPSDSTRRPDIATLKTKDAEAAQIVRETLDKSDTKDA